MITRFWGALPVAIVVGLLALRACVAVSPRDRLAPVESEPSDPPNTTATAGSIYVARGGPVVIGYQASGKARVMVDGRELHECHGIVGGLVCKWVTSPGAHAIRFAAPETARLMWSPVDRKSVV